MVGSASVYPACEMGGTMSCFGDFESRDASCPPSTVEGSRVHNDDASLDPIGVALERIETERDEELDADSDHSNRSDIGPKFSTWFSSSFYPSLMEASGR